MQGSLLGAGHLSVIHDSQQQVSKHATMVWMTLDGSIYIYIYIYMLVAKWERTESEQQISGGRGTGWRMLPLL